MQALSTGGHRPAAFPDDGRRPTGRHRWMLGALLAQVFLVSAYVDVITSDNPTWLIAVTVADLLAFSLLYVIVVGRQLAAPAARRIGVILALLALSVPPFVVLGPDASALWIFVAVAGGLLFAPRIAIGVGIALAAGMLIVDVVAAREPTWELALTLIALTAFMIGFAGNVKLNIALRETREQLAIAAVAAERERIGRDLHDILGHSLTAIAVKAGLARRLIEPDPAAAAAEIAEVEILVRDALADVRVTASGFRDVTLGAELVVAASVLQAAGIRAVLPDTVDQVDPAARELFGFVVREAVTNVVRHSRASTCTVTVGPNWVEVRDDGTDPAAGSPAGGNGLQGLRARVGAVGGHVDHGAAEGGGFVVRAQIPDGAPNAATHRAGWAVR